ELPLVTVSTSLKEGLNCAIQFLQEASARPDFLKRVKVIDAACRGEMSIALSDAPYTVLVGKDEFVKKIDKYCLVEPLLLKKREMPDIINLAYRHQVILSPAR
ncbi:hypothetical protein ACFLU6_15645, partial [Acidobacteriota bacterium]